jgi:hypothetical protein
MLMTDKEELKINSKKIKYDPIKLPQIKNNRSPYLSNKKSNTLIREIPTVS